MTVQQKQKIIQMIAGFFLGRVNLFGINPVGIAFLVSGYLETGIRIPLGISVLLGMFTSFRMEEFLCYFMMILAFICAVDFMEKRNIHLGMIQTLFISLLFSGLTALFRCYLFSYDLIEGIRVWAECILSAAAARVFYDGQHFILNRQKGQYPGNEELISMVLLGMFFALGIPDLQIFGASPIRFVIYFLILLVGYCYGSGAGAMAGTAGGFGLMTLDENLAMIGILSLMGVIAGALRSQSKVVLCAGYFWGIILCSFFVRPEDFVYSDFFHAGLSGLCFFFIPEELFGKAGLHSGKWEDYWESEKLQEILRYKLLDFSKIFQKLSKTLEQEKSYKDTGQDEGIFHVLAATSEQVCSRCENGRDCAGQSAFLEKDKLSEIPLFREDGSLSVTGMPWDFRKECIHQDYFVWEANQNMSRLNMTNSFQNQMLYHQQVVAEQMREVGVIVENLSEQMPKVWKVPQETRERLKRELKKARIKIEECAFYEKHDGRMEVFVKGKTSRGRCVTTKEAEGILKEVLKRNMKVREICRKVFPVQTEEFVFTESVRLRKETGISRASKQNEEISGDTFSCLELSDGKLLLALSDGMGSGEEAYAESERVIELLEQMTEAGFSEKAAVKLINSVYISSERDKSFATADITLINLYQKTAQFIKCGASTTYLFHDQKLIPIEGEALPIGIVSGIEPYMMKTGISEGDYIIMMTDGVSDSFSVENGEIQGLLHSLLSRRCSAIEFSKVLLEEAKRKWEGKPQDDMSVMVVKLY